MDLSKITFQAIIGREPRSTVFSSDQIDQLKEERILVTGAGGSIGSKIVNFLSKIEGLQYFATDRDEGSLHSLSLDLNSTALFDQPQLALLDLREIDGINRCFDFFQPTLVIHAAALKHLSALQKQPREALLTNVYGTANLVDVSVSNKVTKFVNVSTDKAAEPSSVLGFSKRLAELYVASKRNDQFDGFTSCRFGNVFNSRGSVIETFIHQIKYQRPITLTDKNIDRFFMSIEEAAHLTLKSSLINAGDVHIFDMGDPISLEFVIENLQKVLGLRTSILITGLRDGEKMSEVLFANNEVGLPTADSRIDYTDLTNDLNESVDLLKAIQSRDSDLLLDYMSRFTNSIMY